VNLLYSNSIWNS